MKTKKYFMAGTEDELQFGDMIEVDLVKESKHGKMKHQHLECKFTPMLVDMLLENEIIEEHEVEEEKKERTKVEYILKDGNETIEEMLENHENLEKQVEDLNDRVTELEGIIADLLEEDE